MAYGATRRLAVLPTDSDGAAGGTVASAAADGPGVGGPAPDFVTDDARTPLLHDLAGNPIRLADFAGRPLWIVFWATWCTPCQAEAGLIQAAYLAHRDDGLAVLAIDVQDPEVAVAAFARSHGLGYTIGLDPRAAVRALFGGWGLPSHVFVDRRGVIRERYVGQMTGALMEQHLQVIIGP
jgi:cytochrome c biogenesis protein CcmG/thiol:disulfide interchange protein DsbE